MATMKALTPEELRRVLKIAAGESKRNHAMILLAFRHGLRASEVCGLKLPDVDLKKNAITVRRLKRSLETAQPLTDVQGEPVLSELRVLKAWLAERSDPSEFLFTSQKGGRLDRSAFYRLFADIAERAGLSSDKRHPHCLKHALGYAMVARNVNLAVIKQALGHRSIASTALYAVATDEMAGKALNQTMADLF